jgi:hypothetical protein
MASAAARATTPLATVEELAADGAAALDYLARARRSTRSASGPRSQRGRPVCRDSRRATRIAFVVAMAAPACGWGLLLVEQQAAILRAAGDRRRR